MKIRLGLITARPKVHMIVDKPNASLSLGILDCPPDTHRIALKDDYHKKMDMLAWIHMKLNLLEILAKSFEIPITQNQFYLENTFNKAPVQRIAIAMNANSASTGSDTENPFW